MSVMFVALNAIVRRRRQPRSRREELTALRRRFRDRQRLNSGASAVERDLAAQLKQLRRDMSAAMAQPSRCSSCTRGLPAPEGRWPGGHCCSGHTEDVFSDDEIDALSLSGTRARDLRGPRSDHAGCAFRGPLGCSLAVDHRPNVCLRYLCGELRRELHSRGLLRRLEALEEQTHRVFTQFVTHRAERIAAHEWACLEAVALGDWR